VKIDFSKKKKSIIDKIIDNSKFDISEAITSIISGQKDSIIFFETLPFSKELIKAFEIMSLRLGKHFNIQSETIKFINLKTFMVDFYNTLIISIDKKLKITQDIGYVDIQNALRKSENKSEIKKALSVFNCKAKNNYFEFSKNGLIELYAQSAYLNLRKFFQQFRERAEEQKPKTSSLKEESESIKIYKEIIKRTLKGRLDNKKYSEGREDITIAHIIDVAVENGEEYKGLESRFYKWAQRNGERFELLVLEELFKIQSNQFS